MKKVVKLKFAKTKLTPSISVKNINFNNSKNSKNIANSGSMSKRIILNPDGTMMRNINMSIPLTATNKKTDGFKDIIKVHRSISKSKKSIPSAENCYITAKYEADQTQRNSTGNTTEKSERIQIISSRQVNKNDNTINELNLIKSFPQKHEQQQKLKKSQNNLILISEETNKEETKGEKHSLSDSKVKSKTGDDQEVILFLKSIGLEKINTIFLEYNIYKLDELAKLRDSDYSNMKIPLGYKLKILKNLKLRNIVAPEESNPNVRAISYENYSNVENKLSSRESDRSLNTEDIKDKKELNIKSIIKKSSQTPYTNQEKYKKEMKEKVKEKEKGNDFNLEEDVKETHKLIEKGDGSKLILNKNKEKMKGFSKDINLGDDILQSSFTGKVCCWQCLKLFQRNSKHLQEEFKSDDLKEFCSEACLSKYRNQNSIDCFHCKSNLLKSKALTNGGEYFCGEDCVHKSKKLIGKKQK